MITRLGICGLVHLHPASAWDTSSLQGDVGQVRRSSCDPERSLHLHIHLSGYFHQALHLTQAWPQVDLLFSDNLMLLFVAPTLQPPHTYVPNPECLLHVPCITQNHYSTGYFKLDLVYKKYTI